MSEHELEQLEREVEAARGRVAEDLARLRAPGAVAELKEDVTAQVNRAKDQMLDGARDAARQRSDSLMAEIKGRIAANPGAALAIAAGIAWKLYRHPPVTSVLVGAGLMGLMRTDPRHPAMGADAAARAAELAESARATTEEWRHRDLRGRIGARAGEARQRLGDAAESASERLGELAETARERVGAVADAAMEQVQSWTSAATGRSGNGAPRPVDPSRPWDGEWAGPAAGRDSAQRDRYLLGAAAFAMAAAVGIAAQRRFSEYEAADDEDVDPRSLPVPLEVYDRPGARD